MKMILSTGHRRSKQTVGQLKRQVKGSALRQKIFFLTNRPDTLIGQECAALGGQKTLR